MSTCTYVLFALMRHQYCLNIFNLIMQWLQEDLFKLALVLCIPITPYAYIYKFAAL